LIQAHIALAQTLLITVGDALTVKALVEIARQLNAGVRILAQVDSAEEAEMLRQGLHIEVWSPQQALADRMAAWALTPPEPAAHA
jgi:CPA2 family monovalent cation:H+ antiporter-2